MMQFERVEEKEPYEVHDFCKEHVEEQFEIDFDMQTKIKKGAYDHGTEIRQIKDVFTIELREALLRLMGEQK